MAAAPKLVGPAPTGKKRAPENETPRARFIRVAGNRLENALTAIKLLGQIGLSTEYEYTADDVQKIVTAVNNSLKTSATQLTTRKAEKKATALFE